MTVQICATLTPQNTAEAIAMMAEKAGAPLPDMFELRVDAMDECDLAAILAARTRPVIVTNRAAEEGGRRPQNEAERLAVLCRAIELKADYVDVELASLPALRGMAADGLVNRGATKLIVSYHHLSEVPRDIGEIADRIAATEADVVKVVGTARCLADNLLLFDVLRRSRKPTIALAMGELGEMSRLLAGKFGAAVTFAAASAASSGAPGQLPLKVMRDLYRVDRVDAATKVYAVMGNPVGHSLSPAIHNAAFKALGLNAIYLRLKVEGGPAQAVHDLAAIPLEGYSVTIPHKQAVMAACDEIDPLAARIGAVNTLIRQPDGSYRATNTDVTSAMKVLAEAIGRPRMDGLKAAVIGAGGVGRAYVFGLRERGAEVVVTDVDEQRAAELAAGAGAIAGRTAELVNSEFDILMNASPLGMWPKVEQTPVDAAALRPGMIVLDRKSVV